MSGPKSFFLSEDLHRYLVEHGTPPDAILQELTDETVARVGGMSVMQIAPEQGAFMTLLAKLIGAKRAIEVGTFTGYSALCIARGLPSDGQLICCDLSDEWTPSASALASSREACDVYSEGSITQRTFSGPTASAAMVATMALSIPPERPRRTFLKPVLPM